MWWNYNFKFIKRNTPNRILVNRVVPIRQRLGSKPRRTPISLVTRDSSIIQRLSRSTPLNMRRNSLLASTVILSTLYSPSPQQQQREFSAYDGAIDIHMLAVHSIAGDGNHGVALKTLFLLISFSLLLFQTYVLHTMGSDLAMTTCNSNEDCPQGLSCLLEKEVNRCMDCSYQKECFEGMNMISTGEIVTYVGMRNNSSLAI